MERYGTRDAFVRGTFHLVATMYTQCLALRHRNRWRPQFKRVQPWDLTSDSIFGVLRSRARCLFPRDFWHSLTRRRHRPRLHRLNRKRADLATGRAIRGDPAISPADRPRAGLDARRFNRFQVRAQLRADLAIDRPDLDREDPADRCLLMHGGPAIATECDVTIEGISATSIEVVVRYLQSAVSFRLAIAGIFARCRRGCTDTCRLRHRDT